MKKIYVWDQGVRSFHWLLLILVCMCYATEDKWMQLHLISGYAVMGLVLLRILWGFIGSIHARFNDFIFHPIDIFNYLAALTKGKAKSYRGHNPAGGLMIIVLLSMILMVTLSGIMTYESANNPYILKIFTDDIWKFGHWLEEIHEGIAEFMLLFITIHVIGVLVESYLHKENLIKAMINGYKHEKTEK